MGIYPRKHGNIMEYLGKDLVKIAVPCDSSNFCMSFRGHCQETEDRGLAFHRHERNWQRTQHKGDCGNSWKINGGNDGYHNIMSWLIRFKKPFQVIMRGSIPIVND